MVLPASKLHPGTDDYVNEWLCWNKPSKIKNVLGSLEEVDIYVFGLIFRLYIVFLRVDSFLYRYRIDNPVLPLREHEAERLWTTPGEGLYMFSDVTSDYELAE